MRHGVRIISVVTIVIAITLTAAPAAAWSASSSDDASGLDGAIATSPGDVVAIGRDPGPVTAVRFTRAEKLLLRMIPWKIRRTCVPRRTALPRRTVAAVQCRPRARVVRDMAYYLLNGGAAERVFEQRRSDAGVDRSRRCTGGKPAVTYWIGGMPTSELCYRNDDRRANLRFLEPATRCRQLRVAGRTLKVPTVYVAVLGRGRDIARLARWATDGGRARPSVLTRTIRQTNSRPSPACPR